MSDEEAVKAVDSPAYSDNKFLPLEVRLVRNSLACILQLGWERVGSKRVYVSISFVGLTFRYLGLFFGNNELV